MKKILFCASTVSHVKNFHLQYIKALGEMGYHVDILANEMADVLYVEKVLVVPFTKRLFAINNIKAILMCHKLFAVHKYDLIVTNTTLAAAIVRCSLYFLKKRPQVVHIAHGYLFYKPLTIMGYVYLLVELILSPVTDSLVVMNREDEQYAQKYKLYKRNVIFTNGIGFPIERFNIADANKKKNLRQTKGINEKDIVFVYVAEFSKRKNQSLLLKAFAKIDEESAKLVLVGDGSLHEACKELAKKLGIEKKVIFTGYVENVGEWYQLSDAAVSVSKIEGLPFNILEAMACGLPVIASDIKGHKELISDGKNGLLFKSDSFEDCLFALKQFINNMTFYHDQCHSNVLIVNKYSLKNVQVKILAVYLSALVGN